jgi:hypothetical protein
MKAAAIVAMMLVACGGSSVTDHPDPVTDAAEAASCSPETCPTGCCNLGVCEHTSLLCGSNGEACYSCTDQ